MHQSVALSVSRFSLPPSWTCHFLTATAHYTVTARSVYSYFVALTPCGTGIVLSMSASQLLAGKVAIVTGASSGIGEAVARALGAAGAKIVINGRNRSRLERVKQSIVSDRGLATYHVGDVRFEATHRELVQKAIDEFGALHIVVNNVGVYHFGPLEKITSSQLDDMVDVNIKGTFYALKHQLPAIGRYSTAADWGSIVNISAGSTKRSGSITQMGGLVYSATKAAVEQATFLGATAGQKYHVRINAVAPGPVCTAGLKAVGILDKAATDKVARQQTLLQRSGNVEDIAQAILFLVSKNADYVTGTVLPVDGGMSVK